MKNNLRPPGVEPGSIAWKATMLAGTPPTQAILRLCNENRAQLCGV